MLKKLKFYFVGINKLERIKLLVIYEKILSNMVIDGNFIFNAVLLLYFILFRYKEVTFN